MQSEKDNKIYFLFHDWMDWVSKQPPIIHIADSLEDLLDQWSSIYFACPRDLYWMSAVKNGNFNGFNEFGFAINGN